MQGAEEVTFGGSGLDRAAHRRADAAAILADGGTVVPLWRGKACLSGDAPAWLPADHPALADAVEAPLFLGLDDGRPRFAADLSRWAPEDLPDTLGAFADPSEQAHPAIPGAVFAELRGAMTRLDPRTAELLATARGLMEWHRTHGFCARCGARSAIADGGWQRVCPSCGARHFPRTDPVVIMLVTHGNSVLLGRSPGWPDGMYSLLAGFVEPGETVEAAVRRETMEEAGVPVGEVGYLASQPWPFPSSLMLGCRGRALARDITLDPVELEDALWVTKEEMLEVFAGRHDRIRPARPGAIARFLIERWIQDRLDP